MRIKQVLFVSLLAFVIACQEKKNMTNGFEIKGEVKGLGNANILAIKFVNGGIELDSIQAENDAFVYTGKVKEPYFVQLLLQNGDSTTAKLTEFMLENSRIMISGKSTVYDSVQVSGSESDKVLKAYFKEDDVLNTQWDNLKEQYDLAVQAGDSVKRKELAQKLNTIFKVDRVNLLKKYVSNNASSTIGALLPAFCTIEDALTQEDYQEIYETLEDEIKLTDYGKNIAERAGQKAESP
jgi:hypothetical protein